VTSILIAGATGLVGGHALVQALENDRVDRVVAPTRRPLAKHPKLFNPVIDMSRLPADADWWAVDGVVCTLGTTRSAAGSAEAFRAVDLDLQFDVARHAHAHGAQQFALTSSMGADPHSRLLYLRTKGELEIRVAQLGWNSFTIVRPGPIIGDRAEVRMGEKITVAVLTVLAPFLPKRSKGSRAEDIARTLLAAALNGVPGQHLVDAGQLS
jgi:uncharacterized protein YbjT (DUF2867 family)